MTHRITERLQALQGEFDAGQKMLNELDARRAALTTTLLRIEGAMEVLKELSASEPEAPRPNGHGLAAQPD